MENCCVVSVMGVITFPCHLLTCWGGQFSIQATLPHEGGLSTCGESNSMTSQGDQTIESHYSNCSSSTNRILFFFNFQYIVSQICCSNRLYFLLLVDTALQSKIYLTLLYSFSNF